MTKYCEIIRRTYLERAENVVYNTRNIYNQELRQEIYDGKEI